MHLFEEHKREIKRDVYVLQGEQINFYWPQIAEGLKEVPGFYEYYSPEWAYERAQMGLLQIWALSSGSIRAIVLTQISEFPRRRVFEIMAAFGVDLLDFLDEMQDVFERFAILNNCSTFGATCRPGLARLLKRHFNADETYVALRRQVTRKKDQ